MVRVVDVAVAVMEVLVVVLYLAALSSMVWVW
jgi:hypothetical protein